MKFTSRNYYPMKARIYIDKSGEKTKKANFQICVGDKNVLKLLVMRWCRDTRELHNHIYLRRFHNMTSNVPSTQSNDDQSNALNYCQYDKMI